MAETLSAIAVGAAIGFGICFIIWSNAISKRVDRLEDWMLERDNDWKRRVE